MLPLGYNKFTVLQEWLEWVSLHFCIAIVYSVYLVYTVCISMFIRSDQLLLCLKQVHVVAKRHHRSPLYSTSLFVEM